MTATPASVMAAIAAFRDPSRSIARQASITPSGLNPASRARDPGGGWDKDRMLDEINRSSSGLPPALSRREAFMAVWFNGPTPVRGEGGRDVYAFPRRRGR